MSKTSTASSRTPDTAMLTNLCARMRRDSGALIVLCIRPEDVAFNVDPAIAPRDVAQTIEDELPNIVQHITNQRKGSTHAV